MARGSRMSSHFRSRGLTRGAWIWSRGLPGRASAISPGGDRDETFGVEVIRLQGSVLKERAVVVARSGPSTKQAPKMCD